MRELAKLPNTGTAIESQLEPVGNLYTGGSTFSWRPEILAAAVFKPSIHPLLQPPLCAEGTLRDIRAWYDLERPIEEALKSFIRTIKTMIGEDSMNTTRCVCVVTGGANGIGRCIAESFASDGAFVAVIDMDREAGELLAQRFDGLVFYFPGDVGRKGHSRPVCYRSFWETLWRCGCPGQQRLSESQRHLSNCSYDDFLMYNRLV